MDKLVIAFGKKSTIFKKVIGILFFSQLGSQVMAQRIICPADYQSIKGQGILAAEVGAGLKELGYVGTIGILYHLPSEKKFKLGQYRSNVFLKANVDYIQDKMKSDKSQLEHGAFTLDLSCGFIPFSINNTIYPSLLGGAVLTNDFLRNSSAPISNDTKNRLNTLTPGGLIGLEIIAFVGHPRLALVAHADQRYLAKDNFWGMKRQYFWIALRYHFTDVKRVNH